MVQCLFCLSNGCEVIEIDGETGSRLGIISVLCKHFWFQVEYFNAKAVCQICWDKIVSFHQFYCEVEELHKNFNESLIPDILDEKLDDNLIKIEHSFFNGFNNNSQESLTDIPVQPEANTKSEEILNNQDDSSIESHFPAKKTKLKAHTKRKLVSEGDEKSTKKLTKDQIDQIAEEDKQIRDYCKMKCEICATEMQTFHEVRQHYRKVHKQKGYIECCGRKYDERTRILEHILVHVNPEAFKCDQCNRNYAHRRSLQNHKITCHVPRDSLPFNCDKCSKSYAKSYQLVAHQVHHMPEEEKKFICPDCNKPFPTNYILKQHVRQVHEGANSLMCDICSKVLKSKATFLMHRKEHLEVKKVQCNNCGAWLKNWNTLRKHVKSHEEESCLFVCDFCGKRSPNREALLKHKRYSHLMERKYKCNLCDKAFKRPLSLKEHMTTHTGEVLYECQYCDKTFNSSANMHAHKKKIHRTEWEEIQRLKALP